MDRPTGMPNIVSLEVMCGKDHMDVHLKFSHAFDGIVSSKGKCVTQFLHWSGKLYYHGCCNILGVIYRP